MAEVSHMTSSQLPGSVFLSVQCYIFHWYQWFSYMHPFRSTCYDRTVYWPNKQSRHKYYIQNIDYFHQKSCNISTITACLQLLQVTAKPFLHCAWVNHKNPAYIVAEDITTSCFPVSYIHGFGSSRNVYTLKSSKHCNKKLHSKSV